MKLNKQLQYGLLLALYISRGGRVTIEDAAINLNLSQSFLEQVARKLRLAGILKSTKGPGGGYEFTGDPTVRDIFNALAPLALLDADEQHTCRSGGPEHRALLSCTFSITMSMKSVLNRKIRNVMRETVANEVAYLDRLTSDSIGN